MTDTPSSEIGSNQALTHMIDSMRKGQLDITHEGTNLEVNKKLGNGGTKTVYEAVNNGSVFALALPNTVDGVERMTKKWNVALQEPTNTERVRSLGLLANHTCVPLSVNINGVPFTALQMTRYQDLPFPIMDGKNVTSSTVTGDILPADVNDSKFEEYFGKIIPDIRVMIQNGIQVGRDSINICLVNGEPRIFLSDLGNAQFESFTEEQRQPVSERYISFALSAFQNCLTESEYQKHKVFFESEPFKFNNPNSITHRLSEKVVSKHSVE